MYHHSPNGRMLHDETDLDLIFGGGRAAGGGPRGCGALASGSCDEEFAQRLECSYLFG